MNNIITYIINKFNIEPPFAILSKIKKKSMLGFGIRMRKIKNAKMANKQIFNNNSIKNVSNFIH